MHSQKFILSILTAFASILFIGAKNVDEVPGKALFMAECSMCHKINGNSIGPSFQKIRDDYGLQWTVNFIHDPAKMIATDTHAKFAYVVAGNINKSPQPELTEAEIIQILDYVDSVPVNEQTIAHRKISKLSKALFLKRFSDTLSHYLKSCHPIIADSVARVRVDWRQFLNK